MRRYRIAAAVCVLLLAGCGGDAAPGNGASGSSPAGTSAPPGFNATDVMFLQMMIPHHRHGVEIARLAKQRAARRELRTLAAAIEVTQRDEVEAMTGWLRAWGKPATPDPDPGAHAGHGGLPATDPGVLASLRAAKGTDFDRRFLTLMIGHQDDALQLTRMETAGGVNPYAKDLARRIAESRTAQIRLMRGYLG